MWSRQHTDRYKYTHTHTHTIKDRTAHPPPLSPAIKFKEKEKEKKKKMTISSSSTIAAVLTVALVVCAARVAEAQSSDCASKLVPCAEYLNSTTPSAECCSAMRTVVTTQLPCLCGLLKNPGALPVNLTQALELPKYCNISSDTSSCYTAQSPGSSSLPPPATPGGGNGNAAGTISWMGMPTLLLASAFAFFY